MFNKLQAWWSAQKDSSASAPSPWSDIAAEPLPLGKRVDDGAMKCTQLFETLLQDGWPLGAVQVLGAFLDFPPTCAICGQAPFCPIRCTACGRVACQPCVEHRSTLDAASQQWLAPCCGGASHVYDYRFSAAWLVQAPRWPEPSTYRLRFQGDDISGCSLLRLRAGVSWGCPSVSYVDLLESGAVLMTLTRFSEEHLQEVGVTVVEAGRWEQDGHLLHWTLPRANTSEGSAFFAKRASLPAELVLREASLLSGSSLASVAAMRGDAWAPCTDLRLLPTGNAAARPGIEVVKCLRWFHGTSNMLLCLCADAKVVVVKQHELEGADGEAVAAWTTSQRHGHWFELGGLLLVTFNHQGSNRAVSSHALFFDTAPAVYKGLLTWRYGKVSVHAGEVEGRPIALPHLSCFTRSAAWSERPHRILSIDEVEIPTLDQSERDYRSMSPANASLLFDDYLRYLMVVMATDGLNHAATVHLAKHFMKVISLTSHFCTGKDVPTKEEMLETCAVRHETGLAVSGFSLAGDRLRSCYIEGVVGASAALVRLSEMIQPWQDELVHLELIGRHKDGCVVTGYDFQAVRLTYQGFDVPDARARLDAWGLGRRMLPSQLGMALQGASAAARYQISQEYFLQLRRDLDAVAQNPLRGSHYIVLLDVSGSMLFANFLRAYPDQVAEFETLGLDRQMLLGGCNLGIVEHILDSYFVPKLLESGVQVGNAKFAHTVMRMENPSDAPTPFLSDRHLDGGGTEIYQSLMAAAAQLTLPVLNLTGDAGVILITDGEQPRTSMDLSSLARLFDRSFRLEVIGIRARLAGPLQQLVRGSFSVPYQIGSLKSLITALSETLGRIQRRAATAPENRNDIRQPVELYHPNMWWLLDEDSD